jgi:hypothetical protein
MPDDAVKAQLEAVIVRQQLLSDACSEAKHDDAFITCAPNCYDEQREKIALVEFQRVPLFLARLVTIDPHGSVTVAGEEGQEDITFDAHFFGLTQLYPQHFETAISAE